MPTFEVESMPLLKRLTLVISDGRVEKVFYAEEVIAWLAR